MFNKFIFIALMLHLINFNFICSYPSGAPIDVCNSLSPERGHRTQSQPVEYAPFSVVASAKKFSPGDRIGVEIFQRDPNASFKGFIVQALDAQTHQPIGQFIRTKGMNILDECSAVSHSDSRLKRAVNLIWEAPKERAGEIIFRSTIVQTKEIYFANILAYTLDEYYSIANQR